jgi:hypothetical protein
MYGTGMLWDDCVNGKPEYSTVEPHILGQLSERCRDSLLHVCTTIYRCMLLNCVVAGKQLYGIPEWLDLKISI